MCVSNHATSTNYENGSISCNRWPRRDETKDEVAARELATQCGIELRTDGEGLLSQIIRRVRHLTPEQIAGLLTIVRSVHYLQKLQWDHIPSHSGGDYSKREVLALTNGIRRGIAAPLRGVA
jgi:hypothetical protein